MCEGGNLRLLAHTYPPSLYETLSIHVIFVLQINALVKYLLHGK